MDESKELDERIANDLVRSEDITSLDVLYINSLGSLEIKLQLCIALSKSTKPEDKSRSIKLFKELLAAQRYVDEALYYLSILYYSLEKFDDAKEFISDFLRQNPDSTQGRNIHRAVIFKQQKVREREEQNVLKGAAIAGIVAIAAFSLAKEFSGGKR